MYRLYRNQAAAAYSSLYFFIFLSLQFSKIKIFCHFSQELVRPRRLKLGTHGQWADVSCIQELAAAAYLSLYFSFFFLSNFQTSKFFAKFFSGTVSPRKLRLVTHMVNGWMYCVPESGCCCLFILYFFIFLSPQFSNIKFFCHTVLRNCEA